MDLGSIGKKSGFNPLGSTPAKVDKVGTGQTQAGGAEGAAGAKGAEAVGGSAIQYANQVAKTLTDAADKFKMMASSPKDANPFSQQLVQKFTQLATEGQKAVVDFLKGMGGQGQEAHHAEGDESGGIGSKGYSNFLERMATEDKAADMKKNLLEQPLKKKAKDNEDIAKQFGF